MVSLNKKIMDLELRAQKYYETAVKISQKNNARARPIEILNALHFNQAKKGEANLGS